MDNARRIAFLEEQERKRNQAAWYLAGLFFGGLWGLAGGCAIAEKQRRDHEQNRDAFREKAESRRRLSRLEAFEVARHDPSVPKELLEAWRAELFAEVGFDPEVIPAESEVRDGPSSTS